MPWNTKLRDIAVLRKPETLPPDVLLRHTPRTITIFDAFPKAKYHFLLLPRPTATWDSTNLVSLQKVLRADKADAKALLETLEEESRPVVEMIQDEMRKSAGCAWKVNVGFHAVQSMDHLHLHIISSDLVSDRLQKKKHYNSFHPSLGFFIHLDEVLAWFDLPEKDFSQRAALRRGKYELLLKEGLRSFITDETFKTMPPLKEHLEEKWLKETEGGRNRLKRKKERLREQQEQGSSDSESGTNQKKQKRDASEHND